MDEQRKWFLEMETTLGEDAVQIAEMITKDLEYCINLFDKAAATFERIDSNIDKMLSNRLHATEKLFMKGRVN